MGVKRQAKDGHYYERRRTYGGRFYTVQRASDKEEWNTMVWVMSVLFGLFLTPFTYGISLGIGVLMALAATL
jgi:hypothetical protein